MKLFKSTRKNDTVVPSPEWQCFDNCPVCRALEKAAEEGRELSEEEFEEAFAEAEVQD